MEMVESRLLMTELIKKSYYISNNGCARKKLDTQLAIDFFSFNGYDNIDNPANAEFVLFFTYAADNGSEEVAQHATQGDAAWVFH